MKSFYSLIKIAPNSLSDDNLTIGIILSDKHGFRYKFSKEKKQISKSLVSVDNSIIDFLELEIEKKINETNLNFKKSKLELFDFNQNLSSGYFDYLSKYSNGILKFSKPNYIASDLNDSQFEELYKLFVDSTDVNVQKKIKSIDKAFYDRINTNLIERIKDKVHTNFKFDSNLIPTITTFDMDCIGLNGVLVGAKSLPFTQSKDALQKSIQTYISVIAHLSKEKNKNLADNQFFLIADSPTSTKNTTELKFWNQLFQNESLFKLIPSDESEMVAEIIEKRQAHKFLEVV
jgi:hypothetical protein